MFPIRPTRAATFGLSALAAAFLAAGTSLIAVNASMAQDAAAPAQAEVAPDTVVGTIGGVDITQRDLDYTITDLQGQLDQVPPPQKRFAALMALIDIKILAKKAAEEGFEDNEVVKQRLAFLRERTLHNVYFEEQFANAVTDEEVRARYDKEVAATPPQNETRARHILVDSEEKAKDLIAKLQEGADFAELAKENSSDTSAGNGGDLGYFRPGMMVPEFDQAATALDVGAVSTEPVKTDFGYHVIKVEDRRPIQPPPFDQVEQQVRGVVLREKYFNMMEELRGNAGVELTDPALKEAYDAARAQAQSETAQ